MVIVVGNWIGDPSLNPKRNSISHIANNIGKNVNPIIHHRLISLLGKMFGNGPGDLDLIPGHVIPKTLKMVLDTSLLNTQQYKVRIKSKVEQFRERSSALSYTSV